MGAFLPAFILQKTLQMPRRFQFLNMQEIGWDYYGCSDRKGGKVFTGRPGFVGAQEMLVIKHRIGGINLRLRRGVGAFDRKDTTAAGWEEISLIDNTNEG